MQRMKCAAEALNVNELSTQVGAKAPISVVIVPTTKATVPKENMERGSQKGRKACLLQNGGEEEGRGGGN